MRTLVIVHVYYPQLWPELAASIRNITEPRDIVVTYGEESAVAEARHDFPGATFLKCENVGYDIWPFLKALQSADLSRYDVVVKLHTKRDIPTPYCENNAYLGGSVWRERLLGIVKTPHAWQKAVRRLAEPGIGMVADRRVIYDGSMTQSDAGRWETCLAEASRLSGTEVRGGRYVAGTMFAVRAEILRPLQNRTFPAELFAPAVSGSVNNYAHVLERVFGLLVSAAGLRLDGYNGSVDRRNAFYAEKGIFNKIARFFFWRRYVDGEVKIKICRVQIRHRMISVVSS